MNYSHSFKAVAAIIFDHLQSNKNACSLLLYNFRYKHILLHRRRTSMPSTSSRMLLIKLISPKILLKISKMVNFELSFFKISFTSFFLYVPLARNIFYLIRKIMQLDLSINKTVFFLICSSSLVSCCNRQLQMMVSSLTLRDYTLYCNVENTNFTLYRNISSYIVNKIYQAIL